MVLPCVILSGAGAFATAQSKDPEDADCDEAESGNSLDWFDSCRSMQKHFGENTLRLHGKRRMLGILPLNLTTCVAWFRSG